MDDKQKSIVTIIQNMLSQGENADNILLNLKQMGVPEDQAKTLLMIAQTNTLAVLKGEVKNIVSEEFDEKYPNFEEKLKENINDKVNKTETIIKKEVFETLNNKTKEFQTEQQKYVDKIVNVSVQQDSKIQQIQNKLNELGSNYDKLAIGSTKSFFYLRIASFCIGIIIAIFLIYKLFTLVPGYSIDYLLFYIIAGLIATILIVLGLM